MRPIVLFVALLLAACSSPAPVASPATQLQVQNSTTVLITVLVNGGSGMRVAPGVVAGGFVDLPALPWTIEARNQSGATLATMYVGSPRDIGTSAAFPLACGSITIWTGPLPPVAEEPSTDPGVLPECGS